jgi:hypothetical protein
LSEGFPFQHISESKPQKRNIHTFPQQKATENTLKHLFAAEKNQITSNQKPALLALL